MEPGDELWSFSARWDDDWGEPHLREGYALWRRGKLAGFVLSLYQPLEDLGVEAQPAQSGRVAADVQVRKQDLVRRTRIEARVCGMTATSTTGR
jgi:hypothetical protein